MSFAWKRSRKSKGRASLTERILAAEVAEKEEDLCTSAVIVFYSTSRLPR
jgi:hypothetical protein